MWHSLSITLLRGKCLTPRMRTVDWDRLDELFGATYSPDQGQSGHNLSDEDVLCGWVENPYWQSTKDKTDGDSNW